ncbi:AbrB/MazE/SpoVT family DNA-binding domain-containing protein [Methanosaeta sp. UBA356]|jgi:AbrB family looped-hinge helix DNA binding protein|uniref:AbrB/MazE/SpoVT family DNA-binding domain-containing protein n=1 Tax=Methanosaeta sp. UBA356 TaxID=1915559 RepID=UPI00257C2927|nr:hypothetical protein [Methanosaeta sp. UBA356]
MAERIELDATVKVRLHGRITLPQDLREALGIKDGDIVHISVSKIPNKTGVGSSKNPIKGLATA